MIVTEELKQRLRSYMRAQGLSQKEMGQRLGCSGPTVSRWLNGEVGVISQQHARPLVQLLDIDVNAWTSQPEWHERPRQIIRNTPALREFVMREALLRGYDLKSLAHLAGYDKPITLQRLLAGELDFYPAMLSGLLTALELDFDAAPVSPAEAILLHRCYEEGWQTRDAPVLSLAHAANCRTVNGILDLPEFWEAERIPVPTDGRRYAAFRIEGNSMHPAIIAGDIVLCDLDAPVHDGHVVVAKLGDQVMCKRFRHNGQNLHLTSDNAADGEEFLVPPGDVDWLLRAVRTSRQL